MKNIYFLFCLLFVQSIFAQDSWLPMGPVEEDYLAGHYIPIAINNSNEIFISTQGGSTQGLWYLDIKLKQLKDNKWVELPNSTLTVSYSGYNLSSVDFSYKLLVDNNSFYLASSQGEIFEFKNNSWRKIFVNTGVSNNVVDIALDKNNVLYICYIQSDNKKLTVSKFIDNKWVTVGQKDISLQKAYFPSIAFNSDNTPHIAYSDEIANFGLTVQKFNGTEWEIIGSRGITNNYFTTPTIAFDKNNMLYVTYLEDYGTVQKLLKYSNNQWEQLPDVNHNVGYYDYSHFDQRSNKVTSISFDKTNNLFLGAMNIQGNRRLSMYDGISWKNLYSGKSEYGDAKMDNDDNYLCVFEKRIKKFKNGNWSNIIIGDTISISGENEVNNILSEVDKNNTPYICYQEKTNAIILKRFNGITWEEIINNQIFSSTTSISSFKIKKSGEIILLCHNWANELGGYGAAYLFKYFDGKIEKISSVPLSDTKNIKMILDNEEIPHVVYVDLKNSEKTTVKKFINNSWINVGELGVSVWKTEYPSITIDKNNLVYIAYIDLAYDKKLTVKKFDGTAWKNIDKEGFTLSTISSPWIGTNQQNEIYICYGDNSSGGKISVQKLIDDKWNYVGQQGFSKNYGGYSKMLVDSNDIPYVLCRGTEMPPTLYRFKDNVWQEVSNISVYGKYPISYDFAIGQNNIPVITYTNSYKWLFAKYYGPEIYPLSNEDFYTNTKQTTFAYPNPFKTIIHIEGDFSQAQVYDYTGRLIKNTSVINQSIDLSELSSGNYILKLSSGKNQETIKIIKE